MTRRRRHRDKRIEAECAFYDDAGNSLYEADVAVGPIVNDAQIGAIVANGASSERHQQWLIKQPDGDESESKNAADPVRTDRNRGEQRDDEQQYDNNPVDDHRLQSPRKAAIGGFDCSRFDAV